MDKRLRIRQEINPQVATKVVPDGIQDENGVSYQFFTPPWALINLISVHLKTQMQTKRNNPLQRSEITLNIKITKP